MAGDSTWWAHTIHGAGEAGSSKGKQHMQVKGLQRSSYPGELGSKKELCTTTRCLQSDIAVI